MHRVDGLDADAYFQYHLYDRRRTAPELRGYLPDSSGANARLCKNLLFARATGCFIATKSSSRGFSAPVDFRFRSNMECTTPVRIGV